MLSFALRPAALAVVCLFAASFLLTGCGQAVQPVEAAAQNPPAASREARQPTEDRGVKHPLIRALLDSLADTEAEEADLRSVREMLYDADDDLMNATGGVSRAEAILRANEKPPVLLIQPEYVPPGEVPPAVEEPADANVEPSAVPPAETPPPAEEPSPFDDADRS